MLRGIRKASTTWLGRIVMGVVMGLLALIFALWGINDIFRGFGRTTVANIGGTEISIQAFRQTYNQRLQRIGRQVGHALTPEEATALGIGGRVLDEMASEIALDQRARQMGLGVSDAEIVRRVTTEPIFQTPTGQFDRVRFEMMLRNAGYSEKSFVAEQRQETLRRQITDSLTGELPVPQAWLEAINQDRNEERSIEYVALGPAQAGDIPQPTAEALNKYFEGRKILFRAPEYRKIVTAQLMPADIAKWMEISEADIKAAFDEHRTRYIKPERRRVEQMVFPTMPEAEAADARLKGGVSFAALASERSLKEQDVDLGTVTKSDLIDPAVAEAAFALQDGEVSAPVKGRFGAVIVTVLKIEPEQKTSLAEVTPQIRNDIATERAKAEVQRLHNEIEDKRAGGATVEEATATAKLMVATYDVDRSGRDPSGKLIATFPHAGDVVTAAFASDVGVDNDPIDADGGYVWYAVSGITPSRDRTLDEVKSEVEQSWRVDEVASRLKTKAADLLDKLKNGNSLDALAKTDDLKIATAEKLKRRQVAAGMSAAAVAAIFRTAKDSFGSAPGDNPGEWIVFRVTGTDTPKLETDSADAKHLTELVQMQMREDVLRQYAARIEDELGTTINSAALAQALNQSQSAPDID